MQGLNLSMSGADVIYFLHTHCSMENSLKRLYVSIEETLFLIVNHRSPHVKTTFTTKHISWLGSFSLLHKMPEIMYTLSQIGVKCKDAGNEKGATFSHSSPRFILPSWGLNRRPPGHKCYRSSAQPLVYDSPCGIFWSKVLFSSRRSSLLQDLHHHPCKYPRTTG